MKKSRVLYKITGIALALSVLSGCAKTESKTGSEAIELLEPVNASEKMEKAAYRNLYEYETFVGVVYPETETYAFDGSVTFSHFAKFPGEQIVSGEILAYADNTSIQEQIAQTKEALQELSEVYEEDLTQLQEQIDHKQTLIMEKAAFIETTGDESGMLRQELEILKLELQGLYDTYENRKQLYELDCAYYTEPLLQLQEQETNISIRADQSGTVVALGDYEKGDWIGEDTSVIAVADDSVKYVRCDYISQTELEEASRIYAVINGKNYEVEYVPYDKEEYRSIVLAGKAAQSQFIILDPEKEIAFGSLAVITLIHQEAKGALSVPVTALHNDEGGLYLYRVADGKNEKVYVEEGFSDGVYTQILTGISEGDEILLPDYIAYGEQTMTLAKDQFAGSYDREGHIVYPDYEVVSYDVEYGEGRFISYEVERYDTVTEGDVIATVSVQGDQLLVQEKELQLQRMTERMHDMEEDLQSMDTEDDMTKQEVLLEQITLAKQSIDELSLEIEAMKEDYATTQIRASADGIVIWRNEKLEGDILSLQENMVFIASPDTCYLQLSNTQYTLNYGDELFIHYQDSNKEDMTVRTQVLTITSEVLAGELQSEQAYLRLPDEILSYMEEQGRLQQGNHYEQNIFRVTGAPRTVSNVILVPKRAVFVDAGQTYVYVKDTEGNVTAHSFIAGGYDVEYYWVVEGLEEGMTICLE